MLLEVLFAVTLILFLIILYLYRRLQRQLSQLKFDKHSLSAKYGKMTEQFIPFLKDYPYDSQNFRFLGTPIDGIQFEQDKIVFIEFKTGDSRLTAKQKGIKDLILKKKVEFEEVRMR